VPNYYAILGVDPGASRESIKAAYRRLARETHPDGKVLSTGSEQAVFSEQMATLNEAYAVLYDVKQRREYDEELRLRAAIPARQTAPATEAKRGPAPTAGPRTRVRPNNSVDSSVVSQFSNHLRSTLLAHREHFSWKQKEFEGFDWALRASSWSSSFWVGLRGFASVDAVVVKRFINYAEITIAHRKSYLRKGYFVFLLPFQQLSEWESVSSQCRQFVADAGRAGSSNTPTGIVLLDLQHGRTLRFDAQIKEKRYEELLQWVGAPT
jgi:curved DNA-binding protein CbpA